MTTSEQSTGESHTRAFHADSSCQAAGLELQSDQSTCKIQPSMSRGNPRWTVFNVASRVPNTQTRKPHRWRARRQDRCGDEAHGDQAESGHKQSKVEQTRVRVVRSQDDPASQQREVGKLQEDRSKAVVAKAISEATKAVEKASTEAQSYTAEVREGSDGTLSSRMSSPIEPKRNHSTQQRRTSHRGRESEHVARYHAKRE